MWFLAGVRMYVYVCVCACVCVRFSTFETPITHKRLEISIWNLVRQWSNYFHDNWRPIGDLTQANFDLSSWNFVGKCTNTEWCLIPNFFTNRWRPLNFRQIWFFYFFLSWHQIIKIRCIHEAFSWGSPNQVTYPLKERTLWNRRGSNMGIPIHILFFL